MQNILLQRLKEKVLIIRHGRGNILTRCLQDRLGEKRDNMQKAIHIRGKGKEFNFI